MTRLLIYAPSAARIQAQLAAHAPRLELVLLDESGSLTMHGQPTTPETANVDIAWANNEVYESGSGGRFFRAALKSPGLAWLQSASAGYDDPIFARVVAGGVRLTTSHGQAIGMSEYVLSQVLDHFQRGPKRRAAQAAKTWDRLPFAEIMGSDWVIVGFGAIGQAIAQRGRAFGAHITGVRRRNEPDLLADRLVSPDQLASVLPTADAVVLCTPLNAASRHIAGAGFFTTMKPGSILVNVGRGGLVDESALLTALERGAPGHAALDVFETEPLPTDSPFWHHPAVTLTAHASGLTRGQDIRNEALFLDNLARFLAGATLLNEVSADEVLAS